MTDHSGPTALVLGGGGARGAYQAGVLQGIAQYLPELVFPIYTGISAGAINSAFLACHAEDFAQASRDLVELWLSLTPDQVYHTGAFSLFRNAVRWVWRLVSGGAGDREPEARGLLDTSPLERFLRAALVVDKQDVLVGIERNIARGTLQAAALSATSYSTGQSVTWVQGTDIELWQRPHRRSVKDRLTLSHVMASTALPLVFPAVRVGTEWYGDGGVRLTAPLSPALHLGAERILTISTRYARSVEEAEVSQVRGYPPPAQVLGVLYNAVFLDLIDQDILRLEIINRMLRDVPVEHRRGMRPVDILVLRPSRDLGMIAQHYEPRLPKALRFMTRGLGTRRTTSPDFLTLMMFQNDYLKALVDLGERDALTRRGDIERFLAPHAKASAAGRRHHGAM